MSGRGLKRVEGGSMRQKAKLASTHASPSEPSATRQEKASVRTPDRMRSGQAADAVAGDVQAYSKAGVLRVHLLGQIGHRYRREAGQRHALHRPQHQ